MAMDPNVSAQNVQSLLSKGIPQYFVDMNKKGKYVNQNEYNYIASSWKTSPYNVTTQMKKSGIPSLGDLASQKYSFDPNQYLPEIQKTAESIYAPQRAQLEALRQLQSSQAEQTRIKTNADFDKEMKATIEGINARGAFFSGGGVNAQNDVNVRRNYALTDINLQDTAAQAEFLAQQAGLSAAQAEYVQQKLTGVENSAYSRWQDNRNFLMGLNQAQRSVLESDRQFSEDVRQFGLNYALEKKRLKQSKKGESDKTITYVYTGLPTQKTIDMNYNTGGGGGNAGTW